MNYGGFGIEAPPTADVEGILSAFPRLRMKQQFVETCRRLVTMKAQTSHDNFLRAFGERFVARLQSCVKGRSIDECAVR